MMSDGSLSQAEIDALLQSSGGDTIVAGSTPNPPPSVSPPPAASPNPPLSSESPMTSVAPAVPATLPVDISIVEMMIEQTIPALTEIANGLLNAECTVKHTKSEVLDIANLRKVFDSQLVQIKNTITNPSVKGELFHLLPEKDSISLASIIIGQKDLEVNDLVLNALQEAFSQISEPLLQGVGAHRNETIEMGTGEAVRINADELTLPESELVVNSYQMSIAGNTKVVFYQVFERALLDTVSAPQTPSAQDSVMPTEESQSAFPSMPAMTNNVAESSDSSWASMGASPPPVPEVHPVQLNDFSSEVNASHHGSLEFLMDVDMQLTVELGQTHKQVREILQLGEGSIIELDKLAGEPVDVRVNQQLIAKGEVVVIDENFGVRITEIISPAGRIRNVG